MRLRIGSDIVAIEISRLTAGGFQKASRIAVLGAFVFLGSIHPVASSSFCNASSSICLAVEIASAA